MASSFSGLVLQAVDLLPKDGSKVEFEAYKAQLYEKMPAQGRDVFAHMIKNDVIAKELAHDAAQKIVVMLSRKAAK